MFVPHKIRISDLHSDVTDPPASMTAYLDTLVSFHCEGEGDVLVWQTNSVSLTDEIKETRNITVYQDDTTPGFVNSTLVILAKLDNDGLNIGCIVGNHGTFEFDSAGADLFVKGKLYHCKKSLVISTTQVGYLKCSL